MSVPARMLTDRKGWEYIGREGRKKVRKVKKEKQKKEGNKSKHITTSSLACITHLCHC
jgi:hypothetical protein